MTEFTPQEWLQQHGSRVIRMFPDTNGRGSFFNVDVLKRSDTKLTMKVSASGKDWVVKAYNTRRSDAIERFRREVPVLLSLQSTSLVPKMRGYSPEHSFFVSEHVRWRDPLRRLDDERLEQKLRALGTWFAKYDNHAAAKDHESDWFTYLSYYEAIAKNEKLLRHMEFLKTIPIKRLSIAKNDSELSNFVANTDGRLVGIDFEAAAFKPVGWDILLTARVLARLVPDRFDAALDALLGGWAGAVRPMEQNAFKGLARLFASMTAFQGFPLRQPIKNIFLS